MLSVTYWYVPATETFFYSKLCVVIASILLFAVGTVVNVLVIAAYGKNKKLRTSTDLLYLPLAVIDLTVTRIVQPVYVILMVKEMYGTYPCLLVILVCNMS